jgi:hypothetical protein
MAPSIASTTVERERLLPGIKVALIREWVCGFVLATLLPEVWQVSPPRLLDLSW